jgi:hypothetical protein
MARVAIFLIVALAALAQASIPQARDITKSVSSGFDLKAKPLCKECEKVITAVKKILENPELETKLTDALKKVCDLPLLSRWKDQCVNLANDVIVVIHELQAIFDNPTQVCDTLKLCDAQAPSVNTITKRLALSVISKIVQDVRQPHPTMQIDTCGLCTSALNDLKQVLTPDFEDKIKTEVENICSHLGRFQQTCTQLVGTYFLEVFQIINDVLNQPQETCAAIHLCKQQPAQQAVLIGASIPRPRPNLDRFLANITDVQTVRGFKTGCLACETGVKTLIKFLSSDKVVTSIANFATSFVCKLFPSSQKGPCTDFMSIYAKPSLQLTLAEWTPAEICGAIHVCKSTNELAVFKNLSPVEKGKVKCDACKALSKTVAYELQQPAVQQDVINVLTEICLHLPLGKYDNKVHIISYIQTYVPYLLDNILAVSYMPELCTSILHMC